MMHRDSRSNNRRLLGSLPFALVLLASACSSTPASGSGGFDGGGGFDGSDTFNPGGSDVGSGCLASGPAGTSTQQGPYATQRRANEVFQQAAADGCVVSQGTFPCYTADGIRGYCFNIFFD